MNGKKITRQSHDKGPDSQYADKKEQWYTGGKPATKNDVLIVNVRVEDQNGTLCVSDTLSVHMEISGGQLIGSNTVLSEAGIASFVVKTNESNHLKLHATSLIGEISIEYTL